MSMVCAGSGRRQAKPSRTMSNKEDFTQFPLSH
jgi:hypothetical protein